MNQTLLATALLLAALPAGAIELSLEENRAERGNIGYVDIQKLFKTFPETVKAKENFEGLVRQAEDQLNIRKAEILRLRRDIADLKIERELLAKTPIVVSTAPARGPARTPAPAGASTTGFPSAVPQQAGAAPQVVVSTPIVSFSTSAAQKPESLVINLPGLSTGPVLAGPPGSSAGPVLAPSLSTAPAPAAAVVATATQPAAVAASTATAASALAELDARIEAKARDLAGKEADFRAHQAATEKSLLDLEGKKTEILLGRIHKAIQEVARREGVSVVVDKSAILFGHNAVDLTEKVVKHLKGI